MAEKSREEFLQSRKCGLGGSDMGAIMGFSKFRTALDVYNDKVSDEIDLTENPVLRLSSFLEEYTAKLYAESENCRLCKQNKPLIHPQYSFLRGNIDRKITSTNGNMSNFVGAGILECKALSTYNFRNVEMYGLPNEYIIQIQHYFAISRGAYQWGAFAILNRDNGKLLKFKVYPDEVLMAQIVDAGVNFWTNHIEKRIPPELNIENKETVALPPNGAKIEVFDNDNKLAELLMQYKQYAELKAEADSLVNDVKGAIATHLQGHTAVECSNMRIYSTTAIRHTVDTQKLKKEQSEIYYKYLKETETNSIKIFNLNK